MGMYDTIRIEVQLPKYSFITTEEFQTKSFDNLLDNYVITAKGEIYRECWESEWVEDNNLIFKGHFKKIDGSYYRDYLTDLHGDIIFYNGNVIDGKRYNYFARFSYGKLDQIWVREWDRW